MSEQDGIEESKRGLIIIGSGAGFVVGLLVISFVIALIRKLSSEDPTATQSNIRLNYSQTTSMQNPQFISSNNYLQTDQQSVVSNHSQLSSNLDPRLATLRYHYVASTPSEVETRVAQISNPRLETLRNHFVSESLQERGNADNSQTSTVQSDQLLTTSANSSLSNSQVRLPAQLRINNRISLPPNYNEVVQPETPPPSYQTQTHK